MNPVGSKLQLFGMAVPGLIVTTVFVYFPVAVALLLGFFNLETILSEPEFVGLANFRRALESGAFWNAFLNGLVYSFGAILLQVVLGVVFALVLSQSFRGNTFLRGLVILPYVVPSVAAVFVWRWMLDQNIGIINDGLESFGLHVPWFSDAGWAMFTVILISVWLWTPFVALTVMAALQGVPKELYESAHLDGANVFQRFRHVSLPGILPVLVIVILLRGIWMFNKFDVIYLSTGGGPLNSTEHLPILAYRQSFHLFNLGYGASIASLNFVFLMLVVLIYLGLTRRWLRT